MNLKIWIKNLVGSGAAEKTKDELWAVWKYDRFPYAICARIEEFLPNGRVRAAGYRGYTFMPVAVLHGKRGEAFREYLIAARTAHDAIVEAGENAMRDRLKAAFDEFGVAAHTHWRAGFRNTKIAELMDGEIEKILAKEAPAFAYGHDAKPLDIDETKS